MRREYLDLLVTDWTIQNGVGLQARAQAILVDKLLEAIEEALDELRPVGGDYRES